MGDCFYCSKAEPVVQTKAGKIRGFKMNSTYTFHGIKYADADRFQMPVLQFSRNFGTYTVLHRKAFPLQVIPPELFQIPSFLMLPCRI